MLAPAIWANVGIKPKAFLSLYGMVDITNPWYTAAKPPGTQIVHAELDKLDDTKFESFFDSEQQAVWDDESSPFELDTRGGLLFWMLKHGKSHPVPPPNDHLRRDFCNGFRLHSQFPWLC